MAETIESKNKLTFDDYEILNQFELRFYWQFAPLFTGNRPAELFMAKASESKMLRFLLSGTSISYKKLGEKEGRIAYFLYHRDRLEQALKEKKSIMFLAEYGYATALLEYKLKRLSLRYQNYLEYHTEFPHEMGIFLGYPVDDVRGFINNCGHAYIFSGYWKVYSEPEITKKLFETYDNAKNSVLFMIQNELNINTL